MKLTEVAIILSRPAEPGNIGAVCRAMKNMGLSRLRLAGPSIPGADSQDAGINNLALKGEVCCFGKVLDSGFNTLNNALKGGVLNPSPTIIRSRAVHAADIWDRAEYFSTLEEAVADCALVIGTTRRMGSRRKDYSLTPAEAAAFIRDHPGPAALVFGNERTGLEDGELRLCNMASYIPASDAFPSLNLSHAVQIYAYELFRTLAPDLAETGGAADKAPGRWVPLAQEDLDALSRSISDSLARLGFYKQPGREDQELFFRNIFSRSGLTQREGKYIAAIFSKAARLAARLTGEASE